MLASLNLLFPATKGGKQGKLLTIVNSSQKLPFIFKQSKFRLLLANITQTVFFFKSLFLSQQRLQFQSKIVSLKIAFPNWFNIYGESSRCSAASSSTGSSSLRSNIPPAERLVIGVVIVEGPLKKLLRLSRSSSESESSYFTFEVFFSWKEKHFSWIKSNFSFFTRITNVNGINTEQNKLNQIKIFCKLMTPSDCCENLALKVYLLFNTF